MGGSNSRPGSPPPPRPPTHHPRRSPPKRSFSSSFACGGAVSSLLICGASSSTQPPKIEDDPAELLVNSAEHGNWVKFQNPRNDCAVSHPTGPVSTCTNTEIAGSADRSAGASDTSQIGNNSCDAVPSIGGKYLYNSKQLAPHRQLVSNHSSDENSISLDIDQQSEDSVSASRRASIDNESRAVYIGLTHLNRSSSAELVETSSDESSTEIRGTAVIAFPNFHSGSASAVSNSPSNNFMFGDDTIREVDITGSGLVDSERDPDRRDEDASNVNEMSASNVVSGTSVTNNDRRNRRLSWDAFTRRSRSYHDSRSYLFRNDDSDNLRLHDSWILDYGGDFLGEGVGGDFRSYENETQGDNDHQWHSRSEILERIRSEGNAPRTVVCPTGNHPGGSCSCESISRAEENGNRASISRIVVLAEALFEVLDEIHQQPLSFPSPVVSLRAPESAVNSFPMKHYSKPKRSESSDDIAKCYICLAEYEEGDNIRILPCHHEYHMSCVDKWLKEIHGVCPLCRADVRESFIEGSAPALEILSR